MSRQVERWDTVRVSGPLGCYAAEFASQLQAAGYSPRGMRGQLWLMAHLSRWLAAGATSAADLDEPRVEQYLMVRRAAGCYAHYTRAGLARLLDFLAEQGARPATRPVPRPATMLEGFRRYLLSERGLATETVAGYVPRVGRFVADHTTGGDVRGITAADVSRAVVAESRRVRSVSAVQHFAVALRAFLRYCRMEGLIDTDLSAAAVMATGRRGSLLPNGISPGQTKALLRSCDRRTAMGRRDHAILLVLLQLGLRAGEVARLRLEDIDWRAGQIVVHGKGRRDQRLPLPAEVGQAIAGYLRRGRPPGGDRAVFVATLAPWRPLARQAVGSIVRRACQRAGIPPLGPHRLRHGLACAMVAAEVPLVEIGQVLGHRSPISTAIYAKVDIGRLRSLAQPWPDGGEQR